MKVTLQQWVWIGGEGEGDKFEKVVDILVLFVLGDDRRFTPRVDEVVTKAHVFRVSRVQYYDGRDKIVLVGEDAQFGRVCDESEALVQKLVESGFEKVERSRSRKGSAR